MKKTFFLISLIALYAVQLLAGSGSIDSLLDRYNNLPLNASISTQEALLAEIGKQYYEQEDWKSAIVYLNKLVVLSEQDSMHIFAISRLGTAYYQLEMLDRARNSIEKLQALYKKNNNQEGLFDCFVKLGILAERENTPDKALEYYYNALKIDHLTPKQKAAVYGNLATCYGRGKQIDSTVYYALLAIEMHQQNEDVDSNTIALSFSNIAATYINLKQAGIALPYLDSADVYATDTKTKVPIYQNYYKCYFNLGDIIRAELSFDEYVRLKEKILQQQMDSEINELKLSNKREKQLILYSTEKESQLNRVRVIFLLFIVASLVGVIIMLSVIMQNRTKTLKTQAEKITLEQQLLRTQMNPHFTFNVLTNIHALIAGGNSAKASSMLQRFSRLMRTMLENASSSWVSLHTELEAVKEYIKIQEYRFKKPIVMKINMNNCDDHMINIPPMFIQPFVENAVEHGLRDADSPQINIEISQKENKLLIIIEDNGIGINASRKRKTNKKSMSIDINNKRLKILAKQFNVDAYVELSERKPNGTKVTLSLPCNR